MAKPFSISEFLTTTAVLKDRGYVYSNGGYVQNPSVVDTIVGSFQPMDGQQAPFSGSAVDNATHYFLTQDLEADEYGSLAVVEGDILVIGNREFNVVHWEYLDHIGIQYAALYLKEIRE